MQQIYELLHQHRSIRKFSQRAIEEEKLTRILQAGIRASSSGNMQSYSIIVTTDPELKKALYRPHFEQKMVLEAPALITFCADFHRMRTWLKTSEAPDNFDNYMSFMIGAIDATLVSQCAALAAEAEGLGICYMGTTLASSREIGAILKCPKNVVPVVGFVIGYPDETPEVRDRLPYRALVHSEVYQNEGPEEIEEHYTDREVKGWKRYMEIPELRALVENAQVKNLAQVYTKVKYTQESHRLYSKGLLDYLKDQEFLNE